MSDTPRADEEIKRSAAILAREGGEGGWMHMCEVARELERELSEAKAKLEAAEKENADLRHDIGRYVQIALAEGFMAPPKEQL